MDQTPPMWETKRINEKRIPEDERIAQALSENSSGKKTPANMFEITEKIILREKRNAKVALEEFWAMKNNVQNEGGSTAVEEIIDHYQAKLNALRDREDILLKISRESKGLMDSKRERDEALARVRQELKDSEDEVSILHRKIEKLRTRRDELETADRAMRVDLINRENEVIGGIFEISLLKKMDFQEKEVSVIHSAPMPAILPVQKPLAPVPEPRPVMPLPEPEKTVVAPIAAPQVLDVQPMASREVEVEKPVFERKEAVRLPVFPKSIVKTNTGKVIGEYYYDAKMDKEKRQYVFNGPYCMDQTKLGVEILQHGHDNTVYTQLIQMATDSLNRITKKENIHFEISTSEILNAKSLAEVIDDLRSRNYDSLSKFIRRYDGKMEALGGNYERILREQMDRLSTGEAPKSAVIDK